MAVQNSLQEQKKKTGITAYLSADAVKSRINQVIGGAEGQKFIASIVSAVSVNPTLKECENGSILNCALMGHSLKLSPSPQLGQFYMMPFKDKKRGITNASFVIGYKGYIQLAIRSGQYKKLNVLPIKKGELIRYDPLSEAIEVKLIEDEAARENAPTMGYYAMFEYVNGFRKTLYWSKEKMLAHADRYAPAFSAKAYEKILKGEIPDKDMWKFSSFWYKDFDAMGCKTMLRQLLSKWGVLSIEMQNAFEADGNTINDDGSINYVEMEELETEAEEAAPIETTATETTNTETDEPTDAASALFG